MHDSSAIKLNWYYMPALILSISVFLCSLIINTALLPLWHQSQSKKEKIASLKDLTTDQKGFALLARGYRDRLSLLEQKQDSLTQGTAGVTEVSSIIQLVYDAALNEGKSGIKFNKTNPQPEIRRENRIEAPVLFEMTTTYTALGILITHLERYPHLLRIDGLSIQPGSFERLDVTLVVSALLLPEGELGL